MYVFPFSINARFHQMRRLVKCNVKYCTKTIDQQKSHFDIHLSKLNNIRLTKSYLKIKKKIVLLNILYSYTIILCELAIVD